MSVSSIPVMCYYNGHIMRTDNDVKYDGNKASIVPLEIPVDYTFEQLGDIIFASTPIDKRKFNLVLKCKYPLKCGNRFQPFTIWNDRSVHLMLNMVNTTVIEEIELFVEVVRIHRQENRYIGVAEIENLAEIDHGCGPSSGPVLDTGAYGDDYGCAYEKGNDESDEDDDEYDDDLHVQADGHVLSFQTTNQVLENERGLFVSAHALHCDVSNIANDDEGPAESAPIQYHLPPTSCFEHVEALSHDGSRRYGIMTTNMSEVFNSVLKGARSLPISALVQLTFSRLNSYFVARREQGAARLASDEQFTPYVDAQIQGRVIKAGSMEIVLYHPPWPSYP